MSRIRVGVVFGGQSVEHEVSVITAHEVMAALPQSWRVVPVYIAKDGVWYTGDALRDLSRFSDVETLIAESVAVVPAVDVKHSGVLYRQEPRRKLLGGNDEIAARFDVAFPLVHGSHGEDGTLQGLLELSDMAYVGCGVVAAALSMDKPLSRQVFRAAGLPVLEDLVLHRETWRQDRDRAAEQIGFAFPVFVKPATLGSSIGVSRAADRAELDEALELAFSYDARAVIEPAQDEMVEINCSVLGSGDNVTASVCEQPNAAGLLSYADKYAGGKKGGVKTGGSKAGGKGMAHSDRIIPAPISEDLTVKIQSAAKAAFVAIGASGVARVDFMVRPEQDWFVVNEINTIPGALSYYLWEPAGVSFTELLERLIDQAHSRAQVKRESTYSIDDWLLRGAARGPKQAG